MTAKKIRMYRLLSEINLTIVAGERVVMGCVNILVANMDPT